MSRNQWTPQKTLARLIKQAQIVKVIARDALKKYKQKATPKDTEACLEGKDGLRGTGIKTIDDGKVAGLFSL